MFNLTKKEEKIFEKLNTPAKIQDFLDKIPINFDYQKDTCMSPRMVLKKWKCHCIEGAIFAALALRMHGHKPLLVNIKTTKEDFEHVIAIFKTHGKYGCITKTNHAVLRYREPIYNSIRELVMSFFHEYSDKKGKKNMRSYSRQVNLARFDKKNWATDEKDLWYIHDYLDKVKHYKVLNKQQTKNLRRADKIERRAGDLVEWKPGGKKVKWVKFKNT